MRWCIIGLVLVVTACRGTNAPVFQNPKPDLAACLAQPLEELQVPRWDNGSLTVRFAPHAVAACPGPRFPFVAAAAGEGVRYIQLVTVNVDAPDPHSVGDPQYNLTGQRFPWVFLDMEDALRGQGQVFLNRNTNGEFWDNPVWNNAPGPKQRDGQRRWTAHTYAVTTSGDGVRAVGGFQWGWTFDVGAPGPLPVRPVALSMEDWAWDSGLISTWTRVVREGRTPRAPTDGGIQHGVGAR